MEKQKKKLALFACAILVAGLVFAGRVLANGSATVSWTAPTTNADASTPVDLAGYKVYYSASTISCTDWNVASQAVRQADAGALLPSTVRNVANASAVKYTFNNTNYLNPGSTYNFAVVAYDSLGNLSDCTTPANKSVSYSADFNADHRVGINDFTIFAADFGLTSWCGPEHATDINQDCSVNINDFTILAADFGSSF